MPTAVSIVTASGMRIGTVSPIGIMIGTPWAVGPQNCVGS